MNKYSGIENKRFNRWIQKNLDNDGHPPETFKASVRIPLDVAVLFYRRYEAEPIMDVLKNHKVSTEELISHLMWTWANELSLETKGNVFDRFFPNLYRQLKKKKDVVAKRTLKIKNPNETRGRKRKPTEKQLDFLTEDPHTPKER